MPNLGSNPSVAVPNSLSSLIDREREVATVVGLFGGDARLVTLTGPGGVGKTRVAMRAAEELRGSFAAGVAFLDLSPVSEPALLLPTIAHALGLGETDTGSVIERLVAALAGLRLLLVLDNFEQIVSAAPALSRLVSACSTVKALTTSRAILNVTGEYVVPVPPLPIPPSATPIRAEDIATYDSVRLFVARAEAQRSGFRLTDTNAPAIAELCRRLDGLPLAIELAAVRTDHLSPGHILARLDHSLALLSDGARDQPPRLRSMRAAIRWSYDLLAPDQQAFLRRLAIFAGSFDLDGAAAIAGDETDTVQTVADLVRHSLLQRVGPENTGDEGARFCLLGTIRQFLLEQLELTGEAELVRRRLATYALALATEASGHLHGPDQRAWLRRLERDHDTLRATLAWALEREPATALRLGGALWLFWVKAGHLSEGRSWLERALARPAPAGDELRAEAHNGLGSLAGMQGDWKQATASFEAALAIWTRVGSRSGTGRLLEQLASVAMHKGEHARAVPLYEEALALLDGPGDDPWAALARISLGFSHFHLGQQDLGIALCEQGLREQWAIGERWAAATGASMLARMLAARGDRPRAIGHLAAALREHLDQGDDASAGWCLTGLANLALAGGDALRGAWLLGAADRVLARVGAGQKGLHGDEFEYLIGAVGASMSRRDFDQAFAGGQAASAERVMDEVAAMAAGEAETPPAGNGTEAKPRGSTSKSSVLTKRELEILREIANGRTDKEIAARLGVSRRTVTTHVTSILAKLDVESRSAAVALAVRNGWL